MRNSNIHGPLRFYFSKIYIRLMCDTRIRHKKTKSLGMEVLLEVHNQAELEANLFPEVDLIGVNNRNLKTFDVKIK